MSKCIQHIPLESIKRIAVVFGGGRSMVQCKGDADYIMNAGFYDMSTGKPVGHLKTDGTVYSEENWSCWGYAWNQADIAMQQLPASGYDSYISGVPLLTPWDGIGAPLTYNAEVALGLHMVLVSGAHAEAGNHLQGVDVEEAGAVHRYTG